MWQRCAIGASAIVNALSFAAAVLAAGVFSSGARAQHASDNAVLSADDAFGLTLGTESIGIYNPGAVRGFSPQAAGNVRVDGLYFDQRASLSGRVVEKSLIRVGVSAVGSVFPAPTGIVDYDLRHVSGTGPRATVIASAGPFESRAISLDASLPLFSKNLELPIGVGYQIAASNPGYTSNVASFGVAPHWSPSDKVVVRAFFDWSRTSNAKVQPYVFTAGDFLPPDASREYWGQDWAEGTAVSGNYGALVHAKLNERFLLSAGMFRSAYTAPVSYADLYFNTELSGLASHLIVGFPEQETAATSGEVRLTAHFAGKLSSHDIVWIVRGRDARSYYGGSDTVNVGSTFIGRGVQVEKPRFAHSAMTDDRTKMSSAGLAYHGRWPDYGEMSVGVQRDMYGKTVALPGSPQSRLTDRLWRLYGTIAIELGESFSVYAGYAQGLEDSGVAPTTAVNAGTILPAAQTWQVDAGLRYVLASRMKLIAGLFELHKPYFNVDANNIDRELGKQRARGLEFSVSGEVLTNMNVVAGAVIGRVETLGPNLIADGVGRGAIGQPHVRAVFDGNYRFQKWPALSADLSVVYFGAAPATVDNALTSPATTTLDVGARYKLSILGAPATVRFQVQNVLNVHEWNILYSPGFIQYPPPRSILASLTVDI